MTRSFADLHRPGVLVVDDEPAVRPLLATVLPLYGLDVRAAATGHQAVGLYQEHCPDIAVVLLDVRMPGMDGPATLTALRKINPEVRGCFMSGDTGDYTAEDLFGLGAAHVFPKPFA